MLLELLNQPGGNFFWRNSRYPVWLVISFWNLVVVLSSDFEFALYFGSITCKMIFLTKHLHHVGGSHLDCLLPFCTEMCFTHSLYVCGPCSLWVKNWSIDCGFDFWALGLVTPVSWPSWCDCSHEPEMLIASPAVWANTWLRDLSSFSFSMLIFGERNAVLSKCCHTGETSLYSSDCCWVKKGAFYA